MNAPTQMNLEAAMDLADHASPAPWSASLALKAMRAEIERLRSAQEQAAEREQHPDDVAVDQFAEALKAKLAEARTKGRSGWQDKIDCPQQRLSNMLRDHVEKGDPRDVANFCMFLYQRGESILPSQEKAEPVAIEGERFSLLASYLDDGGWHDEASNVRNGVDLESYEVEFRLIDWILRHCKAPPAERVMVPDGMLDRIDAAIQRITDGHAPRRIPADPTDVDLVLAEVRSWLTGQGWPPFWIAAAPEASSHG